MTARAWLLTAAVAVTALTGCSTPAPERASGVEPPPQLVATLVSPIDIELTWRIDAPNAASRIVEFATDPAGPYTILQFVPPGQTSYTHPDLLPHTPFYYRVRPVYGPGSRPVDVTLPAGDLDDKARAADHSWTQPRTVSRGRVATRSIRQPGPAGHGAPTGLRATVMHANGVKLTWVDHASDEEGYLVEVRPRGQADYRTATVLDPDVNSCGLITLREEKKASYRVRAFYYGPSSNVAHQKTGADP